MGNFIDYINQYGILSVIAGAVLFLVYYFIKSEIDKRNKRKESEIKMAEEKARSQMDNEKYEKIFELVARVEATMPQKMAHTTEEQDDDIKVTDAIQRELDCLIKNGAAHSYFITFHNGGTDVLGRGMLKMSMTLESFRPGEKSRLMSWQSIPRSFMPISYGELRKSGDYYVQDVEEIKDSDYRLYSMLKEDGLKSAFYKAIKNEEDLMVGFIGVEYDKCFEDSEEERIAISRKADRIAGIMIGAKI